MPQTSSLPPEQQREEIMRAALAFAGLAHGADSINVLIALRDYSADQAFEGAAIGGGPAAWTRSDLAAEMADELQAKLNTQALREVA